MNNVIPGNYSSDGMPIPFTIAEMKPVYTLDTYSSKPAVDDYNRPFPGNVLDARNQLFTQCWNNTDAQVWPLPKYVLDQLCTLAVAAYTQREVCVYVTSSQLWQHPHATCKPAGLGTVTASMYILSANPV